MSANISQQQCDAVIIAVVINAYNPQQQQTVNGDGGRAGLSGVEIAACASSAVVSRVFGALPGEESPLSHR